MVTSAGLPTRSFTGINVALATREVLVEVIFRLARIPSSDGCNIHLLEMNGIVAADRSSDFAHLLNSACMVVADGRWLELFTKMSENPIIQTRGEDLFRSVLLGDGGPPLKSYFCGSTPEVLTKLESVIRSDFGATEIMGSESPPFRDLTESEVIELGKRIKDSGAQIVWIGISTPRQDFLAATLARLTGQVVVAVGAAFDFLAGTKPSAPRWLSRCGLEWVFRLATEPRRLWRRYLTGGLVFLVRVFRYRKTDS